MLAWLELRIPPVVVALALLLLMRLSERLALPLADDAAVLVPASLVLMLVGGGITALGLGAFGRRKTTTDPMHPERSAALVDSGIYRFSRNPMYVGFAVMLLGAALQINAWPALAGPVLLVGWLHRFQVLPEERALLESFGSAFVDYCRRVPRWLGWPRGAP